MRDFQEPALLAEGAGSAAMPADAAAAEIAALDVGLDRDVFTRQLIRELVGTLQDVVGSEDAAGYISVVGSAIGAQMDEGYRAALGVERLSRAQVDAVLVDLKRRIEGRFVIVESTDRRVVFANSACPFGDKVLGRPSLCMMTSNVFGHIAASNTGYAAVTLERTIARGDPGCRVIVHFAPDDATEPESREYFGS